MFWRRSNDEGAAEGLTPDERLSEQLSAYLDDELTEAERAAVEDALANDDAARQQLDDLRLIQSAFASLGDVRAPRSFAIPAPAAAASTGPTLPMFRRVEGLFRAAAAGAALLFVVAVVNDPGGDTPVAGTFNLSEGQLEQAAAGSAELLPAAPASAGEDVQAFAPAPELVPPEDGARSTSEAGEATAADTAAGTMEAATAAGASEALPPNAGGGLEEATTAFAPLPEGTDPPRPASEEVGGMAPALATLTGLLTALSALLAWSRRSARRNP